MQSEQPKSLLDYVSEEMAEIEQLHRETDAERAKVPKIRARIHEAELAYYARREELKKPDRSRVLAEAALAGAKAPPEPLDPPGPSLSDLEATKRGLEVVLKETEERITAMNGRVRAKINAAWRAAAERAAVEYVAAAKVVQRTHAIIAAAQTGVGHRSECAFIGPDWGQHLEIPATDALAAMKGQGMEAYYRRVVAGGGFDNCARLATKVHEGARAEIIRRLGRWPFDRE